MARIIDSEPDMHCVGQVPSVSEVSQAARDADADALVLDLSLTGGSSMTLIEELTSSMPALRIVVFSGLANAEEAARETKKRGAAEFVSKGCDFNVLLEAIRRSPETSDSMLNCRAIWARNRVDRPALRSCLVTPGSLLS